MNIFARIDRKTGINTRQVLDQDPSDCILWHGAMHPKETHTYRGGRRQSKPFLRGIGNPVRVLFAYIRGIEKLDPLVWLKRQCPEGRCINPNHYKALATYNMYHDRTGEIPQDAFERGVTEVLQLLKDGEDREIIEEYCNPDHVKEAMRRWNSSEI